MILIIAHSPVRVRQHPAPFQLPFTVPRFRPAAWEGAAYVRSLCPRHMPRPRPFKKSHAVFHIFPLLMKWPAWAVARPQMHLARCILSPVHLSSSLWPINSHCLSRVTSIVQFLSSCKFFYMIALTSQTFPSTYIRALDNSVVVFVAVVCQRCVCDVSLCLWLWGSVLESPSRLDEEHRLIARYAARLAAEAGNSTVSVSEKRPVVGCSQPAFHIECSDKLLLRTWLDFLRKRRGYLFSSSFTCLIIPQQLSSALRVVNPSDFMPGRFGNIFAQHGNSKWSLIRQQTLLKQLLYPKYNRRASGAFVCRVLEQNHHLFL